MHAGRTFSRSFCVRSLSLSASACAAAPPRGHVWDVRAQQQLISTARRPRRASVPPRTAHSTPRPSLCSSRSAGSLGATLRKQDAFIRQKSAASVWTVQFEGMVLHPKGHGLSNAPCKALCKRTLDLCILLCRTEKVVCRPCPVLDCPLGRLLACYYRPLHAHALAPGYIESMITCLLHVAPGRWQGHQLQGRTSLRGAAGSRDASATRSAAVLVSVASSASSSLASLIIAAKSASTSSASAFT